MRAAFTRTVPRTGWRRMRPQSSDGRRPGLRYHLNSFLAMPSTRRLAAAPERQKKLRAGDMTHVHSLSSIPGNAGHDWGHYLWTRSATSWYSVASALGSCVRMEAGNRLCCLLNRCGLQTRAAVAARPNQLAEPLQAPRPALKSPPGNADRSLPATRQTWTRAAAGGVPRFASNLQPRPVTCLPSCLLAHSHNWLP